MDTEKSEAATTIAKWYQNQSGRRKVIAGLRSEVDSFFDQSSSSELSAIELFHTGQKVLFFYHDIKDKKRLQRLGEVILKSMENKNLEVCYAALAFNKTFAVKWMKQAKLILLKSCVLLQSLKVGLARDMDSINVFLSVFVTLTDYTLWKITARLGDAMKPTLHRLCTSFVTYLMEHKLFSCLHEFLLNALGTQRIRITGEMLPAAMGVRCLALCSFSEVIMAQFVCCVLTIPACIWHLQVISPETVVQLNQVNILERCVNLLRTKSPLVAEDMKKRNSTELICLVANLIQLRNLQISVSVGDHSDEAFVVVLKDLLVQCKPSKTSQTSTSTWHVFFGWTDLHLDKRLLDGLCFVRSQLQLVTQKAFVDKLFKPLFKLAPQPTGEGKSAFRILKEMFSVPGRRGDEALMKKILPVTNFYMSCLSNLPQLAGDIFIGLSCNGLLCAKLWYLLRHSYGLNVKLTVSLLLKPQDFPESSVLSMFLHMAQHLASVLDDHELRDEQCYLPVDELDKICNLLARAVYACIWSKALPPKHSPTMSACLGLLALLYQRDCRQSFCKPGTWLVPDVNVGRVLSGYKSQESQAISVLHLIPFIIPYRKRVQLFYERINSDKVSLGIVGRHGQRPATYVTIRRNFLLDDGYERLSTLSTTAMKGTIRVKFINEQGLEEAGIDEMGVFKEFLEETIKQAFNPGLSLFKVNSSGCLYPSPTSHVQENHLHVFEFLGTILGKAVYEGVVVDVPLAFFFLGQLVKQVHSSLYSSLDELSSMDQELNKSLHLVKHYDGDVSDLVLTFSFDEEFLGKIITHELVPGGSGIPVTNANRINYVHRMAHYKMHTEIKSQCESFLKGFHSLVPPSWLSFFSPKELQQIISGEDSELDINDLRKHTQYAGGYHDRHKVILWLWDVLKNDCNSEMKSKFLKFVTSCSKAPLLGFGQLDPPFTIRMVVSKQSEEEDSVGASIRGFLGFGSDVNERLPTASTCFNLLKLPNYKKKSTLKAKLTLAITSNAGFELS